LFLGFVFFDFSALFQAKKNQKKTKKKPKKKFGKEKKYQLKSLRKENLNFKR